MKSILKRKFVLGAIAVAALAGAGGAYAATEGSTGSTGPSQQEQAYVNDLAARLGVSTSALTAAIKAADDDQINKALAAGNLTQAQADALKSRIDSTTTAPFLGRGMFRARLGGRLGSIAAAAATYLGITTSTLRSDLESGRSLDQIAAATSGKTAAGLRAAIVSAATDQLNAAVKNGAITSAQETQRLNDLGNRIDTLMQRTNVGLGRFWGRAHRFGAYPGGPVADAPTA